MLTREFAEYRATGRVMGMQPVLASRVASDGPSAHNMGIDLQLLEAPSTV
jgi:hypothetical protein